MSDLLHEYFVYFGSWVVLPISTKFKKKSDILQNCAFDFYIRDHYIFIKCSGETEGKQGYNIKSFSLSIPNDLILITCDIMCNMAQNKQYND